MKFRIDIQALRGLAVLFVLVDHARFGALRAGFLGVDIFFVISGYLITQLITGSIERGDFSFVHFYFRRAKRLLPATYVTCLATAILSAVLLTSNELKNFAAQLLGAVTFTANIALWRQTGYFDGAAAMKPLLHVWSLAIEEQYYMLLPATLVFVPKRFWTLVAILLFIASLALCLVEAPLRPSATFYLLPTRAWELGIGSIGALTLGKLEFDKTLSVLFWPTLIALLIIPFAPISPVHPGIDAIIVCLATLVVILRRHIILNENVVARAFARVGDFSYSLYLVHWPIFAYVNNIYATENLPIKVRFAALALSFLLGFLLYRGVELPVRRARIVLSWKTVGATLATSMIIVVLPVIVIAAQTHGVDYAYLLRSNEGFGSACDFTENFTPTPVCRNAAAPKLLVWGDSLAMALVPGIAATLNGGDGIMQATRSLCGPILGLAPINYLNGYNRAWAEQCVQFNESVKDYISTTPSIDVVVMSSSFRQYVDSGYRQFQVRGSESVEHGADIGYALAEMKHTIAEIRSLGKRVIIVAPPPPPTRTLTWGFAWNVRPGVCCSLDQMQSAGSRRGAIGNVWRSCSSCSKKRVSRPTSRYCASIAFFVRTNRA